jgi:hypothetical protein
MSGKVAKHFFCRAHRFYFKSDEWLENEDGVVYAVCPMCSEPTDEVPHYYANLSKMWDNAPGTHTGPKTPQGKKRSSLNGFKHGLYTKQCTVLAPALPGRYAQCKHCDYFEECSADYKYCPVNLSLMLKFLRAYEEGNVKDLKEFAGISQGMAFQTLQMMFADVFMRGVQSEKVINKVIDKDEDGEKVEIETVKELQSNPLLKRIPEFMNALGQLAEQQMMTPKNEKDDANMKGLIDAENSKTVSLEESLKKQEQGIKDLQETIKKAAADRDNDPAMQSYKKELEDEKRTDKDGKQG